MNPMADGKAIIWVMTPVEALGQSLKRFFDMNGYRAVWIHSESVIGAEAQKESPSVILVDRGIRWYEQIRQHRALCGIPIVVLQMGEVPCPAEDCSEELERDVDAVICNESPRQLMARIRAIIRRRNYSPTPQLQYNAGSVLMDLDRHEVTVNGRQVQLTPKEFQILRNFLESPSRVFSRQEMLNRVWGEGYALEEHALDVHIHSLRKKIEADPGAPRMIVTVRGVGYKLRT
jgi:DNA-binding response OmpR family regulator